MPPQQCVLCVKPEAEFIAFKVSKQELSPTQAAKELGVTLPEWVTHYELHVRDKLVNAIAHDIEPFKDGLIDKIKEARASMIRVITFTKDISEKLKNKDIQGNIKLIAVYATLEGNIMKNLKDLAILEGDISTATTINIQNNTLKVDAIINIVMEDAPPELQAKILKKLKNLTPNAN